LEAACRAAGRTVEADDALRRATDLSARAAADAESVVNLGLFIDLTAAMARGDFKGGRPKEARASVERLVEAGRKLAARFGPPSPTEHPDRNRATRQQAHRFRQIADLAGEAGRPADAVEFYTRLLAFARAAARPAAAGPDPEVYELTEAAHWGLSIVYDRTGRPAEALTHWTELLGLSAWDYPGSYSEPACRHLASKGKELTAKGQPADPVGVLAPGFTERHARLASQPTSVPARIELRRGYRVLGLVLEHQQKYADALAAYDRGLAVGPVPETAPEVASPAERELLSVTLQGRIACLESLGQTGTADAAWAASTRWQSGGI
jgi:tetratricopeptide (TPR) repeat protein